METALTAFSDRKHPGRPMRTAVVAEDPVPALHYGRYPGVFLHQRPEGTRRCFFARIGRPARRKRGRESIPPQ